MRTVPKFKPRPVIRTDRQAGQAIQYVEWLIGKANGEYARAGASPTLNKDWAKRVDRAEAYELEAQAWLEIVRLFMFRTAA
jgi:hypothetical protein